MALGDISVAALAEPDFKAIEHQLLKLDRHLTLRTFVDGYSLSQFDRNIWVALRSNKAAYAFLRKGSLVNLARWFAYIEETHPEIQAEIKVADDAIKSKKAAQSKAGSSYNVALQDTEKGVVTRFPPEPSYFSLLFYPAGHKTNNSYSGYLHIGHAKAALLNDYFAHDLYKGTLILRFDDTNPSKEKKEFKDAIVADLELLGIKPDRPISYTSDYFELLYEYAIELIKIGFAYTDDTPQEEMRDQRFKGIASKRRDESVEQNLAIFEEMKKGIALGYCLRAKISVDNPNKAMRDPVIYRCNPEPHDRTGTKWKMYPTYDFSMPLVDAHEGVTHALRTTEYADRNPQYQWFLDVLKLRQVHVWDFSRLNLIRTFLSKRKLTKLVDNGIVWGWDDPRMPTVRGVYRRGMTIPALRDFILKQGPSRNMTFQDWTNFWATNKKLIDPIVPRYTAVDSKDAVVGTILSGPSDVYTEEKPKHGKNPSVGTKAVTYSSKILLDQADAKLFLKDEEITLMNWGNAIVHNIFGSNPITSIELKLHLAGDVKKTDKKVTWLSVEGQTLIPAELKDFGYLMTKDKLEEDDNWEDFVTKGEDFYSVSKAVVAENAKDLKAGEIIQLERKGYYRVDEVYAEPGKPLVLFNIPTGKANK